MQQNEAPFPWRDFIAPRFWPSWLALLLLRLIVFLPYPAQMSIGKVFGEIFYRLAAYRRSIAATNIGLCFPELTQQAQQRLVHDHFHALGMMLIETALSWWGSDKALKKRISIKNIEIIHQALAAGKGAIILGAHYTTVDISGRLFTYDNEFAVSFQEMKNPLFNEITLRARQRIFKKVFARDQIRQTFRYIKQNHLMWIAADQDAQVDHSIFVPFFGQPASTQTVPSRMAKITGAPVIPYLSRRLADNQGYEIEIFPPIENFPSDSVEADIRRTNAILEQLIRKAPEQYLWVHRRFKTRPEGMPPVYPEKKKKR